MFLLRHAEGVIRSPFASDDLNQNNDHGDDEQDMDEAANGGGRDHPKQP